MTFEISLRLNSRGGGCQAGGDKFAARESVAHDNCLLEMAWPVIMARMRQQYLAQDRHESHHEHNQ